MRVQSLGREDPLEEKMATHSSILAGKSRGQRSLAGFSPGGRKVSDTTKQLSTHTHTHTLLKSICGCSQEGRSVTQKGFNTR